MELRFDVKMTVSALYDYNMHYAYTGTSGIVGTAVGALFLVLFAAYMNPYYLIAGIVIIIYTPLTLYLRSAKLIKLNPMFRNTIHYCMDEEGVTISQNDEEIKVEWNQMYRAQSTNQSLLLYTGPKSAWIFPKKDLGEKRYEVIEMISTHMAPDKVRIKQ